MITIKINVADFVKKAKSFVGNVDEAVFAGGDRFCRTAVSYLQHSALSQNLIWRGKLFNGIRWRKISKYHWIVTVPLEGVYVDSMTPHWVKLKRGRPIRQWA